MSVHFQREIGKLKKKILKLSAVVEENVRRAVKSVDERNADLAGEVVRSDVGIDRTEVEIEEYCLKLLALYQPVAGDLRFIVSVLKINRDLERIGDLAVNIAGSGATLATLPRIDVPFHFHRMVEKVQAMVRKSLSCLIERDPKAAREVCWADREVDEIYKGMIGQVRERIRARPEWADRLVTLLSVSRDLERIADHATNIAEDLIYMIEGEIIRHNCRLQVTAS
jgi:phosphate transport system protein